MENSYGIGVHNRYELFYNDEVDPLDILKESEKKVKDKQSEKENKITTKVLGKKGSILKKPAKNEQPTKISDKANTTGESRNQNQRGPRNNDSRVKFSDREERNNRRNRSDDFNNSPRFDGESGGRGRVDGENRGRFEGEGRGRGRGRFMSRGRGRGRGGMGGSDGRGKREFDRQSGMVTSSVKAVDKREGSGSFNWGSDKDQIEDYHAEETNELDTSNENTEKTEEPGQTTEADDAPKEEEHREMTLDEWKALQNQRSKPQFNLRKAGEGENTNQWKKTYILKKKEEEDQSDEEDDDDEEEVIHGRRKVLLDIDFKFSDSPVRGRGRGRGRGDRGGKGRGMGRGGMGERGPRGDRGRGGRGRQEAPRMDDEQDFPSLG